MYILYVIQGQQVIGRHTYVNRLVVPLCPHICTSSPTYLNRYLFRLPFSIKSCRFDSPLRRFHKTTCGVVTFQIIKGPIKIVIYLRTICIFLPSGPCLAWSSCRPTPASEAAQDRPTLWAVEHTPRRRWVKVPAEIEVYGCHNSFAYILDLHRSSDCL